MIAAGAFSALNLQAQNLLNGSFEDGLSNWDVSSLAVQNNTSFSLKAGSNYLEKWTNPGSAVGDASVSQTMTGLPAGVYTLTVAAQNIQQNSPDEKQTGVWIFANDVKVEVSELKDYSLSIPLITGSKALCTVRPIRNRRFTMKRVPIIWSQTAVSIVCR